MKDICPNAKGSLYSRIREMESEGLLPSSLIELLDHVRIFGNTSLHDDDDPSKEDCSTARDFADLFLTYSYSLPAKISAAKAEAQG